MKKKVTDMLKKKGTTLLGSLSQLELKKHSSVNKGILPGNFLLATAAKMAPYKRETH